MNYNVQWTESISHTSLSRGSCMYANQHEVVNCLSRRNPLVSLSIYRPTPDIIWATSYARPKEDSSSMNLPKISVNRRP